MNKENLRPQELDSFFLPAAVLREGSLVYANRAFLALIGYQSFSELHGLALSRLVAGVTQEQLDSHLANAGHTSATGSQYAQLDIALRRREGKPLPVSMASDGVSFNGRESVLCSFTRKSSAAGPRPGSSRAAEQQRVESSQDVPELAEKATSRPWKLYGCVIFLLLAVALPGAVLPKMELNNAPKVYLPETAEAVVIDDKLRETFPNDQGMVFLFEGVALFSEGFMLAMHNLTQALLSLQQVEKVISVTSQDHIQGTDDGFIVEPLIDIDTNTPRNDAQRRDHVLADRFAYRSLVAPDASALAIVVIPVTMDDSIARMNLQAQVRDLVAQHKLANYVSAEAGQVTTDVEQLRETIAQNVRFIPIVMAIGMAMIWLLFRRPLAVAVSGVVIAAVVGSTLSLYVLFAQPFNLISSILPPLLSALTIAALVHLYNALQHASRRGKVGPERVAAALGEIRRPALYNALTTTAGFAALGLSEIPPIRTLGLTTAAGVVFIYLVVFQFLPPIFSAWDNASWAGSHQRTRLLERIVSGLSRTGMRHPVWVISLTLLTLAGCSPLLGNIVVETSLLEFFSPAHPTRVATARIEEKLVGIGSLDVVFTAPESGVLATPATLTMIRDFQRWAEAQPEVDKTTSFADFVEEMHWGFHAQQDKFRSIPDDTDLISQYLFVYDGTDLYDFVDESLQTTRVSLNVNVHAAGEISDLMDRLRAYLTTHSNPELDWEIAGISRMFADQVKLLVTGQVNSILGALAIIFLLMLVQWRSLKDSLICMVPNLSPIVMIFTLMGALNIWLDMATAMIASVAVGIAIDDTIHVFHGFIHRVRRGINPTVALARTYRQAGRAIMVTTVVLSSQFLVLAMSNFIPIRNFGLLSSVGMIAALLFDLLLLPAILILLYRPRPSSTN